MSLKLRTLHRLPLMGAFVLSLLLLPPTLAKAQKTWYPSGAQKGPMPQKCHPYSLESAWWNSDQTPQELAEEFKSRWQECYRAWQGQTPHRLQALPSLSNKSYQSFKVGKYHLGHLLAQPLDDDPKPLVILLSDPFQKWQNSSFLKAWSRHFAEEKGFHVLILESRLNLNSELPFLMGGFFTGRMVLQVANWVRFQSPLRHNLSGVHLIARGWSGHTALYASLYNDHIQPNDDIKSLNSVTALCPVVSLQKAWSKQVYEFWPWQNFLKFMGWQDYAPPELKKTITQYHTQHIKKIRQKINFKPFNPFSWTYPWEYWNYNEGLKAFKNFETPTLIWTTSNDPALNHNEHSEAIKNLNSESVARIKTLTGGPCDFSATHGWQSGSALISGFVRKNSYDYWIKRQKKPIPFTAPSPQKDEAHSHQEFQVLKNQIHLDFHFYNHNGEKRFERVQLSRNQLPLEIPESLNKEKAWQWSRWLNTNVVLYTTGGPAVGTKEPVRSWQW